MKGTMTSTAYVHAGARAAQSFISYSSFKDEIPFLLPFPAQE